MDLASCDEAPIAQNAFRDDLGTLELFAQTGLHWVAMKALHCDKSRRAKATKAQQSAEPLQRALCHLSF